MVKKRMPFAYPFSLFLAMSGIEECSRCIGAAFVGADGLHEDVAKADHWQAIKLYYNQHDRVYLFNNKEVIPALEGWQEVVLQPSRPGAHSLKDYVDNGSISDIFRRIVFILGHKS